MKNSILLLISALLLSFGAYAQDDNSKFSTLEIKTSAVCDMCIASIEKGFAFEKGVKSSKVDLAANTVTVTYHTKKTDAESVKKALARMGYSADEMAPNPKAYADLHYCCKADHDHGDH